METHTQHGRIRGRLRMVTADGVERRTHNSVLEGGAGLVARLFAGMSPAAPIDRVNVGFGTEPLGPGGVALRPGAADPATLHGPIGPADFTVSTTGDAVRVSITATFTPTVELDGVTEAGLSAGDVLYNHVLFDPVKLEADHAVSFFWDIDFPFDH